WHRLRLGRGGGLHLRHHPAAGEPAAVSARNSLGLGPESRRLPAVPDRRVDRDHGGVRGGAPINPPPRARGGRPGATTPRPGGWGSTSIASSPSLLRSAAGLPVSAARSPSRSSGSITHSPSPISSTS